MSDTSMRDFLVTCGELRRVEVTARSPYQAARKAIVLLRPKRVAPLMEIIDLTKATSFCSTEKVLRELKLWKGRR